MDPWNHGMSSVHLDPGTKVCRVNPRKPSRALDRPKQPLSAWFSRVLLLALIELAVIESPLWVVAWCVVHLLPSLSRVVAPESPRPRLLCATPR